MSPTPDDLAPQAREQLDQIERARGTRCPTCSPLGPGDGQCWTCATSRTTYMGGYATISTGRLRAALASALGGGEQQ